MAELIQQPGFAHASLAADRHELPVLTDRACQGFAKGL